MSFTPVPAASIAAMVVTILLCIGVILAFLIVLRKKYQAGMSFFLGGCICFPLFVIGLENLLHQLVLSGPWGVVLQQNVWLYALYGGLAAGIFEELGRFLFLSLLMRRDSRPQNALMYGIGHGGIEAILLVVVTYINNIVYSVMINTGEIAAMLESLDDTTRSVFAAQLAALSTANPGLFLLGGVERFLAMALHIALSVLVFNGIRRRQFGYVLQAIALHAMVDAVSVLISVVAPAVVVELAVLLMVAFIGMYAARLYQKLRKEERE